MDTLRFNISLGGKLYLQFAWCLRVWAVFLNLNYWWRLSWWVLPFIRFSRRFYVSQDVLRKLTRQARQPNEVTTFWQKTARFPVTPFYSTNFVPNVLYSYHFANLRKVKILAHLSGKSAKSHRPVLERRPSMHRPGIAGWQQNSLNWNTYSVWILANPQIQFDSICILFLNVLIVCNFSLLCNFWLC